MQREELVNKYHELQDKEKNLEEERERLESSLPADFVKAVKEHKEKAVTTVGPRTRGRPKKGELSFNQKVENTIKGINKPTISVRDIAISLNCDKDEFYLRKIRHVCYKLIKAGTNLELPAAYKAKSFSLDAQLKIKS